MTLIGRMVGWSFVSLSMIVLLSVSAHAQAQSAAGQPAQPSGSQAANVMTCTSRIGERIQCTADTSGGVALVRSSGAAPCLFGDTWGFALQDVIQKPGNIKSILSTFQNKIKGQF